MAGITALLDEFRLAYIKTMWVRGLNRIDNRDTRSVKYRLRGEARG